MALVALTRSPCCSPLPRRQRVAEQQAREQHRQELPRRHDGRKQQRAVAPDCVRDEQLTCAGKPRLPVSPRWAEQMAHVRQVSRTLCSWTDVRQATVADGSTCPSPVVAAMDSAKIEPSALGCCHTKRTAGTSWPLVSSPAAGAGCIRSAQRKDGEEAPCSLMALGRGSWDPRQKSCT
jgi:hypothetical protein